MNRTISALRTLAGVHCWTTLLVAVASMTVSACVDVDDSLGPGTK